MFVTVPVLCANDHFGGAPVHRLSGSGRLAGKQSLICCFFNISIILLHAYSETTFPPAIPASNWVMSSAVTKFGPSLSAETIISLLLMLLFRKLSSFIVLWIKFIPKRLIIIFVAVLSLWMIISVITS